MPTPNDLPISISPVVQDIVLQVNKDPPINLTIGDVINLTTINNSSEFETIERFYSGDATPILLGNPFTGTILKFLLVIETAFTGVLTVEIGDLEFSFPSSSSDAFEIFINQLFTNVQPKLFIQNTNPSEPLGQGFIQLKKGI
jgi:hypothetical protein